jgi:hypothetical protein
MFVRSAAIISCRPCTEDMLTRVASSVLRPKRIRRTGMMAANEKRDKIVDSRLKRIFNAIWVLYGGTNRFIK